MNSYRSPQPQTMNDHQKVQPKACTFEIGAPKLHSWVIKTTQLQSLKPKTPSLSLVLFPANPCTPNFTPVNPKTNPKPQRHVLARMKNPSRNFTGMRVWDLGVPGLLFRFRVSGLLRTPLSSKPYVGPFET